MRISTENFIRSIYLERLYFVSRHLAFAQKSFVLNYCPLVELDPRQKQKKIELEMIFYRQAALFDVYCTSICSRARSVMFEENY